MADTIYINDDGLVANVNSITGKTPTPIGDGYLRLFTAPTTCSQTRVIGDFTECTFTGYAAINLTVANWAAAAVAAHLAFAALGTPAVFTRSTTGAGQTVYGWFLTDSGKTVLYACAIFSAGPYVVTNAGDAITVVPTLSEQSLN